MKETDLRSLFLDQNKTLLEISNMFNMTAGNVSYWLKKYNIRKVNNKSDNPLIQWIYDNCYNTKGTINNRIMKLEWWSDDVNVLEQIKQRTKHIETDNISQMLYHVMNDKDVGVCTNCEKPTNFMQFHSGYRDYCSLECSYKCDVRNSKIKNNSDYVERVKTVQASNIEKYGVACNFQLQTVVDKIKETKIERYGSMANSNNPEKTKQTCLQRYGVEFAAQVPEFKQKGIDTKIERYGTSLPPIASFSESKAELELLNFLNDNSNYTFVKDRFLLKHFELDAYCEELKLAVEYCGLYWHSAEYKKSDYHYKKYLLCKELGVKLITVFEDEWIYRNDQVRNFLKANLGSFNKRVYARNCIIREINYKDYRNFFEKNHIQGSPNQIKHMFGLFKNEELLGCVSYAKHHRNSKDVVLNRLAFVSGVQVVGGASKLVKNSIQQLPYNKIITWSDNRWSDGGIYLKSGFVLDKNLRIDYSYVIKNKKCMKRKSKQSMNKKSIGCPENITEEQFLLNKKIYRIHDCGKIRWIYNKE